jgi:hypothetical protein
MPSRYQGDKKVLECLRIGVTSAAKFSPLDDDLKQQLIHHLGWAELAQLLALSSTNEERLLEALADRII